MTTISLKTEGASLTLYLDAPTRNGQKTAAIGKFRCKSAEAGAALLETALEQARASGAQQVIGPMDGDTWHSYRFVTETDGSPAFLMEPPERPAESAALRGAGFAEIEQYFSARMDLRAPPSAAPPETDAFTITPWDGTEPDAMLRKVFAVSSEAFAHNVFYKEIDEAAFLALYAPTVPLMKRELILFAKRPDGTLAGFLFGIPNYAEGPEPRAVILKTYASLEPGAGRHLVYAFNTAARDLGYKTAIHALIHESNRSAERSAAEGGQVFRRYALFGRALNA